MNWLKYFLTFVVCISDFMILAAMATIIFNVSCSPAGFLVVLILFYGVYKAYKQTGGLSHWKKETRQQFYKNFDQLQNGEKPIKY